MTTTKIEDLPTVYDPKETEDSIINFGKMENILRLMQKATNRLILS